MEIISNINEIIEICWEVKDPVYPYSDILILTKQEYENITKEEIETIQIDKYNSWKLYMLNPN